MMIRVHSQGFSLLIMPISTVQWHVEIGMFNPTYKSRFINKKSLRVVGLSSAFCFGICFIFVGLMLFACGDIELNLDPKKRSSCYNYNLNINGYS